MNESNKSTVALEQCFLDQICNLAKKEPLIQKILLFGSRASHTQRERSDIDLCIFSKEETSKIHFKLDLEEDTTIPYQFDVVYWDRLSDERFKKEILKTGGVIYEKEG